MGLRRRAALRAWGRDVVRVHTPAVADLMGLRAPLPRVHVHVVRRDDVAAFCVRNHVALSEPWFTEHPDDAGAVVHELSHALLALTRIPEGTSWLLEGVADLARNHVGLEASWSAPHHEPGAATAGYQTTAHFLAWLEGEVPGSVAHAVAAARSGRHDELRFTPDGRSLADVVAAYEAHHAG